MMCVSRFGSALKGAGLLCGVSILALSLSIETSRAACAPDPAADGDNIVCTGTSDGFRDDEFDDGTVTVETGAVIDADDQGILVKDDVGITNDGSVGSKDDHAIEGDDDVTVTNNGDIVSVSKDGIHVDKDAVIVNNGTITGGDEGIQAGERSTITNNGSITGDDRGIDAEEDDVTVTNAGSVGAESDGIRVGADGNVTNTADGVINAGDDGIQAGENSRVVNNGKIFAGKEGVNANEYGATVINNGTINSVDDAINAAGGATIVNTGTLYVTGVQDGIDLDDGNVLNTGTIISVGGEDGIDFDENGTGPSFVTNSGHISGHIGINADEADMADQTILNTGTLIGTGGTAVALRGGNDTLQVGSGSLIDGLIDLGAGNNTFAIIGPVSGVFTLADDSYDVQLNGYNAIYVTPQTGARSALPVSAPAVIAIDSSPFTAIDASVSEFGMDLSQAIGTAPSSDRLFWTRAFGGWSDFDAAAMTQGFDLGGSGFVAGRNWDHGNSMLGFFAGGALYGASLDDGVHDTRFLAGFAGLRAARSVAPDTTVSGSVWLGGAEARIESSELASGDGSTTGVIAGFDTGFAYAPAAARFVLEGAAGYSGFFGDTMDLDSLGAVISGVASHHFHASLEAGAPFVLGGGTLTPFLRVEADASTDAGLSATAVGTTIGLGADDVTSGVGIFGGVKFQAMAADSVNISARIAVGTDTNSTLSVDGKLTLTVPF
ncbi:beta strand repeat-containing protein [Oricola sp.]|uniref:beta strand repeat-containing protein n=1 Tax=Oricola sp. TaxID=1979950 RepID=UPI0035125908